LELRKKEQTLVKQGHYDEAQKVKGKADALQSREKIKIDEDVSESVERKLCQIRKSHELEIGVFLKRIQRDRNDHLKEKTRNSQRFLQRNKNQIHDLLVKHGQESKRIVAVLKKILFNIKLGNKVESQKSKLSQSSSPLKSPHSMKNK